MSSPPGIVSTITIFSLLGPPIGNVIVVFSAWLTAALAETPASSGDAQLTFWMLLFSLLLGGVPFAFLYGFVPAFITGAAYGSLLSLSERFCSTRKILRAITASVLGAASTSCASVWLNEKWSLESLEVSFIVAGATAASFIGYFWPPTAVFVHNDTQPMREDARG